MFKNVCDGKTGFCRIPQMTDKHFVQRNKAAYSRIKVRFITRRQCYNESSKKGGCVCKRFTQSPKACTAR